MRKLKIISIWGTLIVCSAIFAGCADKPSDENFSANTSVQTASSASETPSPTEASTIASDVLSTQESTPEATLSHTEASSTEAPPPPDAGSEGKITYIDGVIIANKTYCLPRNYNPGVDFEALHAFETLQRGANDDGLEFWIASGFRSYDHQAGLYAYYCNRDGQAAADTYSARPGHSEHQTGLAFDVNIVDDSFAGTPEAVWLEKNGYKYGFIIRYPKGKEEITGYQYEPWHIRYLGVDLATKVYNSGLTLEEYFDISSVYQDEANG